MSLYDELNDEMKSKVQSTMQNIQQLQRFWEMFKRKDSDRNEAVQNSVNEAVSDDTLTNFTFTGNYTDLSYFLQSEKMPLSAISNIADSNIKEAVIKIIDKATEKNLIEIDGDKLIITEKGKAEITKPDFIKSAQKDQAEAYNQRIKNMLDKNCTPNEAQMCVELTGDYINDFTFFNHSDKLDLSTIMNHPDKQLSDRILANIKQWQANGAVTVKDGVATVTDMGKRMLQMSEFKAMANNPVTEKALSATGVGKVIVATKKVVQVIQSVQKATNTISKGTR